LESEFLGLILIEGQPREPALHHEIDRHHPVGVIDVDDLVRRDVATATQRWPSNAVERTPRVGRDDERPHVGGRCQFRA
jgi:hypothetical protein